MIIHIVLIGGIIAVSGMPKMVSTTRPPLGTNRKGLIEGVHDLVLSTPPFKLDKTTDLTIRLTIDDYDTRNVLMPDRSGIAEQRMVLGLDEPMAIGMSQDEVTAPLGEIDVRLIGVADSTGTYHMSLGPTHLLLRKKGISVMDDRDVPIPSLTRSVIDRRTTVKGP